MPVWLIIIIAAVSGVAVLAYFMHRINKKQTKREEEQKEAIEETKIEVTMLVIDKKKMKIQDTDLPDIILEKVPKYARRMKFPIVKAKVGPKIMTLIADQQVFEVLPLKKEVKATLSGLYITEAKGLRGPLDKPQKKKGFFRNMFGAMAGR